MPMNKTRVSVIINSFQARSKQFDFHFGFSQPNTIVIKSDKNIIVDPGTISAVLSGALKHSLERGEIGLKLHDIDIVVNTHLHFDHCAANFIFRNKKLVFHKNEIDFITKRYSPEYLKAFIDNLDAQPITGSCRIARDVSLVETPGHTPGSISVLVKIEDDLIAILGDLAMKKNEYVHHKPPFRMWDQKIWRNSLDKIINLKPTLVIPGHDKPFAP